MMYEVSISNVSPIISINVALRTKDGAPVKPNSSAVEPLYDNGIFSDFAVNRSFFAVDRGGLYHDVADANAERFHNYFESWRKSTTHGVLPDGGAIDDLEQNSIPCVRIILKVLAYNRPKSLNRLLISLREFNISSDAIFTNWLVQTILGNADYLGHDGFVDLEILLDGPRYDTHTNEGKAERNLLDRAWQVAEDFTWPFGEKRLF